MLLFNMNTVSCMAVILLILYFSGDASASEWNYNHEDEWPTNCKEGRRQSPIALSRSVATEANNLLSIKFRYYHNTLNMIYKNNGHSAELRQTSQETTRPYVEGVNSDSNEAYVLDHLHFHWSSEHTIEGYRYPLELHLVHHDSKYRNIREAINFPGGVAVFSVLFELSPDDDTAFIPLIDVIQRLHDKVELAQQINDIQLDSFLPRDTAGYYRYNGSLTTPDCTEGVIWTVFTNTLPISKSQVENFATLATNKNHTLRNNYRSIQQLNDRQVLLRSSPIRNSSHRSIFSFKKIIILLLVFLLFSAY